MTFPFEQLEVWRRSVDFVEKVLSLADQKIDRKDGFSLGEQLRRAVISISNNIAEGSGRNNRKEKRYFYNIAKGSVYEVVNLLEICKKRGYLEAEPHAVFYKQAEEIARMLSGLMNSVRSNE
jgi:four helix bundle protein